MDTLTMAKLEQFEVLQLHGEKWELVAAFQDLELATEVARNRRSNIRVVRVSFEDEKRVLEEILLDLGSTRDVA
jgi:aromatic ring-opening dioxygenase LigB subunit